MGDSPPYVPALRHISGTTDTLEPRPIVLNDRYEVGRLLGTGGMAAVHVARDRLLGREVAVKLFRRQVSDTPDLRLQQLEARVVATLNHPSLTTLLDAGVEGVDGGPPQIYLVMEYVRGQNLRQRLRQGPLLVADACWLGFELAEGLDYMHQSGYVHRDVKPANILLSELQSARSLVAKLTDFGIAAPIGQPDLGEYTVGTAAYLSPEQVEGHDAVPASDTYSLGVVVLESLTGKVVFPGSVEESAFARLDRDPPIPASIPVPVAELVSRMTARRPTERISLHEAALGLQQFLVDDLIERRTASAPSASTSPTATHRSMPIGVEMNGNADDTCDALLRLLAKSLGAPKSLLTVDDGARTVAKSHFGWDVPVVIAPGSRSRDQIAIGGAPWSSRDVRETDGDRRLLPVVDIRIRAAAAVALFANDGRRLGTLFVFDHASRDFGEEDIAALNDTAALLVHEFELRAVARRALLGEA